MAHNVLHQNLEYFNKEAATYDTKHVDLLQKVGAGLRDNVDFIGANWSKNAGGTKSSSARSGEPVRMLDYACGTGMISRVLGDYVDRCVGIDLSDQMVEVYNKRAQEEGLSRESRYAVQGNLADPEDPEPAALSGPEFRGFDIAAVGGGFHHFEHPELAAERLVERLRPGGVLAVWDFFAHDHMYDHHAHGHDHGHGDKPHDAEHTITRHGFTEAELRSMFEAAGAGAGFAVLDMGEYSMENHGRVMTRRVFIARGQKKQ